jgi:hypothetical protein
MNSSTSSVGAQAAGFSTIQSSANPVSSNQDGKSEKVLADDQPLAATPFASAADERSQERTAISKFYTKILHNGGHLSC